MRTILVCGGVDYKNAQLLYKVLLDEHYPDDVEDGVRGQIRHILTGDRSGAEWLACKWAVEAKVLCTTYPIHHLQFGKRAFMVRNKQMLDHEDIDLVIAFPGGIVTRNMITQAKLSGISIRMIDDV